MRVLQRLPDFASVSLSLLQRLDRDQAAMYMLECLLGLLCLAAMYFFYCIFYYPFYKSPLRHIPTVPGCPLWGHGWTLYSEEIGVPQRRWHAQYGPAIRYFFPFAGEKLSFADGQALKEMTTKNPYGFQKPAKSIAWMARILGDGLLLAEGVRHKHQRSIYRKAFSPRAIDAMRPIFWETGLELVDELTRVVRTSSEAVEVLELLDRVTLDIICKAGFDVDWNAFQRTTNALSTAYPRALKAGVTTVRGFVLRNIVPHGVHGLFGSESEYDAACNTVMREVDKIADARQRLSSPGQKQDILSLILSDPNSDDNFESSLEDLSPTGIRGQIMTFLGAGHVTTSTSTTWTLHLLARNPKIQSRLHAELRAHFPFLFDASLSREHLLSRLASADVTKLPYLHNVFRELLRYLPPIPATMRVNTHDAVLGGYFVPAGTTIHILPHTLHRLPEFWGDDADSFDPERWERMGGEMPPRHAYMPFSFGLRGCIGQRYAEVVVKTLLCCVVSRFVVEGEVGRGDPEVDKFWSFVLRPRNGVWLRLREVGGKERDGEVEEEGEVMKEGEVEKAGEAQKED